MVAPVGFEGTQVMASWHHGNPMPSRAVAETALVCKNKRRLTLFVADSAEELGCSRSFYLSLLV